MKIRKSERKRVYKLIANELSMTVDEAAVFYHDLFGRERKEWLYKLRG